jgi:hypothetical protein
MWFKPFIGQFNGIPCIYLQLQVTWEDGYDFIIVDRGLPHHSGRTVYVVNRLRLLEHWDRVFEFH